MMQPFRKLDLEGYVRIDHRDSPGLTEEHSFLLGMRGLNLGSGTLFEGSTLTCKHCRATVFKNPARVRERATCSGCDHFICDPCAAEFQRTGQCLPFEKLCDMVIDATAKGLPIELPGRFTTKGA